MTTFEITSVSSKGQVVIPGPIRAALGIKPGTKLAVITDGENVLLKLIEAPKLSAFQDLVAESRALARKRGLAKGDVKRIVRKVRDASRR